jgi:HAMP domain-containing protein
MAEQTQPAAPAEPTYGEALIQVIKGLKDQYPLLFGIGAGIILLGVLAATGNTTALAIVAAVLVISLAVWLFWAARVQQRAGARHAVTAKRVRLRRSAIGTEEGPVSGGGHVVDVEDVDAEDSPIGTQKGS